MRSSRRASLLVWTSLPLLLGGSVAAQDDPAGGSAASQTSLERASRQINNPISPLWQLTWTLDLNGQRAMGPDPKGPSVTSTLLPQVPIHPDWLGLGGVGWAEDLQLVTRMSVPFVEGIPEARPSGETTWSWGFGDIQLGAVVAPRRESGFVWGAGPTFIFPSASDEALGQGKWQAGPAAVAGYLGSQWSIYAVAQQWWSFAGDRDRSATSQLCLNYVVLRNFWETWQIGMQPSMAVDWKARSEDRVSFPVGLGIGKTFQLGDIPVQLWAEGDYYAVRPRNVPGPVWGVTLQLTAVIPGPTRSAPVDQNSN